MPAAPEPAAVQVRAASERDLTAVAELRWQWSLERGRTPTTSRDEFVTGFLQWAARHRESHRCFVLERHAEILGTAWLASVPRVPTPMAPERSSGDLQGVYVVPAERNHGLGSLLVSHVLDVAAGLGMERVTVHSSAGAVTAYERLGFGRSQLLLQVTPSA